jgi:hypothetical protein
MECLGARVVCAELGRYEREALAFQAFSSSCDNDYPDGLIRIFNSSFYGSRVLPRHSNDITLRISIVAVVVVRSARWK